MEEVLDIYKTPYDPQCPQVCMDEMSTQLIGEVRAPLPAEPGKPLRYDTEYKRNGTANMFIAFEPFTGSWALLVTCYHPPPRLSSSGILYGRIWDTAYKSTLLYIERRMELLPGLLPQAPLLHLETWQIDTTTAQVTLRVQSTQTLVSCPVCRFPTRRIHSRSRRTIADLPWAHYRVVWQLSVRKFCCANGRCPRRIVTERLPGVVAPWARRTERLLHWLAPIAVALGGAAGAQLSRCLGGAVSRRTLLRVLRRLPVPTLATPTVLGVDDCAMRTRQT